MVSTDNIMPKTQLYGFSQHAYPGAGAMNADYLFRVLTMNVIVGGQLNYWVRDAGTLGMISLCTAITRQGNAHDILVAV